MYSPREYLQLLEAYEELQYKYKELEEENFCLRDELEERKQEKEDNSDVKPPIDTKDHDKHYKLCVFEPIQAMQSLLTKEQFKGFLLGNIIKYRLRAGYKGNTTQDDIDKAKRYEKWVEELEKKGEIKSDSQE